MNKETIRREMRVAFSTKAQPVWFRVVKWLAIIVFTRRFHSRPWFPRAVACVLVAAVTLHLFYRKKTDNWTKAWGGWDDLAATLQ